MCEAVAQFQRMLARMEDFPKARMIAGEELRTISRCNLEHRSAPFASLVLVKWALYRARFLQIKFTFCSPCACFAARYASLFKALKYARAEAVMMSVSAP